MNRRMSLALGLTMALVATTGCASGRIRGATDGEAAAAPTAADIQVAAAPTSADVKVAVADTTATGDHVHASGGSSTSQAAAEVVGQLEFHAFDLGFDPMTVTVDAPGTYAITFVNDGVIAHDMTFDDGTKLSAEAGTTVTGEVVVPAEGIGFICSVPGHAAAGMTGSIGVSADAPAASAAPEAPAASPAASHAADGHGGPLPLGDYPLDPNAPAPVTYDAHAPARLAGEVHDIQLVMIEKLMTVAPGIQQQVWTFGGTVPGPVIRVKLGDTVRVHLMNPATNTMAHSIDFHASQVAWNDEMRSIDPGEDLVYEWKADYAGVWMYHCGTAPALHHIANGMFGMVIVEPAEGLPPVDQEFALVQSEWYLGAQGQVTDLSKAMAAAPAPDLVVFNGVANQYKDAPLKVDTNDRVRFFILDAGPSVDSSFHIVGTIFDTVIEEGVKLQPGNDGNWGAQAVDLSPAQGAIVELSPKEDGLYPIVTHAFNLVGRGALGLLQAGDGDPSN
jgi:nitrite reductase (NO-forming)